MENARAWAKAKAKEKAEIAKVNAKDMESARAEVKERAREKTYYVQRAAAESASNIRAKARA